MIEFSGWLMPVSYSGILQEHRCVRNHVGIFDISHMGVFTVKGTKSESWLNSMLTNDVRSMALGEGQYTLLLNERAGVIDDMLIYRLEDQQFMMVVNAARKHMDWEWMQQHLTREVTVDDLSNQLAALAIQGPKSSELIEKVFPHQSILPRRHKLFHWEESTPPLWIARTGYTGEDGFELFFPTEHAADLWQQFIKKADPLQGGPAGLGARDTLRLEACLPLNGNDLSPEITPLEAGLRPFINFDKPEKFIGRGVLREQLEQGIPRKSMALKMINASPPPRKGYPVFLQSRDIGIVTSGASSPTLGCGIALALIQSEYAQSDLDVEVEIRNKRYPARLTKKPLYRRPT